MRQRVFYSPVRRKPFYRRWRWWVMVLILGGLFVKSQVPPELDKPPEQMMAMAEMAPASPEVEQVTVMAAASSPLTLLSELQQQIAETGTMVTNGDYEGFFAKFEDVAKGGIAAILRNGFFQTFWKAFNQDIDPLVFEEAAQRVEDLHVWT